MTARPSTPAPSPGKVPNDPAFSWKLAKNIYRVQAQREKRRKNPPKKNKPIVRCKVCDRNFRNAHQLAEHKGTAKHKNAEKREEPKELGGWECSLCELSFDRESNLLSHLNGRLHLASKRRHFGSI